MSAVDVYVYVCHHNSIVATTRTRETKTKKEDDLR